LNATTDKNKRIFSREKKIMGGRTFKYGGGIGKNKEFF
jgi:hypothetical protein